MSFFADSPQASVTVQKIHTVMLHQLQLKATWLSSAASAAPSTLPRAGHSHIQADARYHRLLSSGSRESFPQNATRLKLFSTDLLSCSCSSGSKAPVHRSTSISTSTIQV
jgi:hypothetical protein